MVVWLYISSGMAHLKFFAVAYFEIGGKNLFCRITVKFFLSVLFSITLFVRYFCNIRYKYIRIAENQRRRTWGNAHLG
jgi:hypothetical protein